MSDWEDRKAATLLLGACMVLGAFVGTIVGIEFTAGLGESWAFFGGAAGGVAGVALGAASGQVSYRNGGQEYEASGTNRWDSLPADDVPVRECDGHGKHVERLAQERAQRTASGRRVG
jgi:hypothetical protein